MTRTELVAGLIAAGFERRTVPTDANAWNANAVEWYVWRFPADHPNNAYGQTDCGVALNADGAGRVDQWGSASADDQTDCPEHTYRFGPDDYAGLMAHVVAYTAGQPLPETSRLISE